LAAREERGRPPGRRTISSQRAITPSPEARTRAMAPLPGGVERAQMGSKSSMNDGFGKDNKRSALSVLKCLECLKYLKGYGWFGFWRMPAGTIWRNRSDPLHLEGNKPYEMKNTLMKNNWIYGMLLLSFVAAVMSLITSKFVFKSGTAAIGILIIFILNVLNRPYRASWLIIGAFLFSIAGDWFLSHKNGDSGMFSTGIAMFFFAHVGYLLYAKKNGRIDWKVTGMILLLFLAFFFVVLYPNISDRTLMIATLIYLLISCLSFGASVGIKDDPVIKWSYVFGIFLVLFSDTIISLSEFVGYKTLDMLILPTYYLAHISITFSLIRKMNR
jgi:uncharacterized membrane protein YhhN